MNTNHKMTPTMKKEVRKRLLKNTNIARYYKSLSKDPEGFKKGVLNELGNRKSKGEVMAHAVTLLCCYITAEQKGFSLLDDLIFSEEEPDKTILELIRAMKILGVVFDLDGYALHNKMLSTLVEIFQFTPEMMKNLYDGIQQAPVAQSG